MNKNIFNRQIIFYPVLLVLTLSFFGCGREKPYARESRFLMGTVIEITCQDEEAIHAAFQQIEIVENLLNKFDENSEISQINSHRKSEVSWKTLQIIKKAKFFHSVSGGVFDISIAPLSEIWKKAIKDEVLPKDRDIRRAKNLVNSNKILIDEIASSVKLAKRGMKLDLGAIAKGFAVDVAVKKLKELGVNSCLINAGGEIYCLGRKHGKPWKVGVKHPRSSDMIEYLELENKAVATSGDYEQFFLLQDTHYSHIIDPRTGCPADSGIVSVTVIADDCLTADALATSIFILGKTDSRELIKNFSNIKTIIFNEVDLNV